MRRNHPYKDIFIVHSKKNRTERDIASGIAKILYKNGYTIWNYQDWKWTNEILTTYSSSGTNIDVVRFISGARDSFIEEDGGDINIQDLSSIILKRTRLVICINPVTGKPRSGVREEVQILTNDQGKTIPLFGCPRRIILCSVENREPHHIFSNLSYSDLINICLTEDDPQKDEIDSFKVGFYPSVCSIAAITAFIARYLWLQSLENKEGKGKIPDYSTRTHKHPPRL